MSSIHRVSPGELKNFYKAIEKIPHKISPEELRIVNAVKEAFLHKRSVQFSPSDFQIFRALRIKILGKNSGEVLYHPSTFLYLLSPWSNAPTDQVIREFHALTKDQQKILLRAIAHFTVNDHSMILTKKEGELLYPLTLRLQELSRSRAGKTVPNAQPFAHGLFQLLYPELRGISTSSPAKRLEIVTRGEYNVRRECDADFIKLIEMKGSPEYSAHAELLKLKLNALANLYKPYADGDPVFALLYAKALADLYEVDVDHRDIILPQINTYMEKAFSDNGPVGETLQISAFGVKGAENIRDTILIPEEKRGFALLDLLRRNPPGYFFGHFQPLGHIPKPSIFPKPVKGIGLKVDEIRVRRDDFTPIDKAGRIQLGKPKIEGDEIVYHFVAKEDEVNYCRFERAKKGGWLYLLGEFFVTRAQKEKRLQFAERLLLTQKGVEMPVAVKLDAAERLHQAEKAGQYKLTKVAIWEKRQGKYHVTLFLEGSAKLLGEGGFGVVYERPSITLDALENSETWKAHAQKILRYSLDEYVKSEKQAAFVLSYIKAKFGGIMPKGIAELSRMFTYEGVTTFIMKLYSLGELYAWIRKKSPGLDELTERMRDPMAALITFTTLGIQYFDLKLENIFINLSKTVIADFGGSFILCATDRSKSLKENFIEISKWLGSADQPPTHSTFFTPHEELQRYETRLSTLLPLIHQIPEMKNDELEAFEAGKDHYLDQYEELKSWGEKVQVFQMGIIQLMLFLGIKDQNKLTDYFDYHKRGVQDYLVGVKTEEIKIALQQREVRREIEKTFGPNSLDKVQAFLLNLLEYDPDKRLTTQQAHDAYEELIALKHAHLSRT
jgi:serine/threonine protein kinase